MRKVTAFVIYHQLNFDRFAKSFVKNYNSSDYKWTLSSGGTSEYYCELAAGGDPKKRAALAMETYSVFLPPLNTPPVKLLKR